MIGISVSVHRDIDAQNLNFAIPSRYLTELIATSQPAKPLVQGFRSISAETYFNWGNTKYNLGDYKGAINDYTHGIQLRPDDATAYIIRGIEKTKLNRAWGAENDFLKALEIAEKAGDASKLETIEWWLNRLDKM